MVNTANMIRETCNDDDNNILQNAISMLLQSATMVAKQSISSDTAIDASKRSVLGHRVSVQEEPLHFSITLLHSPQLSTGFVITTGPP
jgi:hypothetical protein